MITPFVLDKTVILERLGGDEDIYSMMLDAFLLDVDNNCATLQAAVVAGDQALLQREAHTVKGLLATFSDEAGAAMAFTLEQQARAGENTDAAERVAALVARIGEVAGVLRGQSGG